MPEPTVTIPWPALDDLLQAVGITIIIPGGIDLVVQITEGTIGTLDYLISDSCPEPEVHDHFSGELDKWEQQLTPPIEPPA